MFSVVIKQVFNFADGRTVLTGLVEGNGARIQPGRYGLYQGKLLMHEVEVEGEMVPKTNGSRRAERAVSIARRIGPAFGEPQKGLTLAPLNRWASANNSSGSEIASPSMSAS